MARKRYIAEEIIGKLREALARDGRPLISHYGLRR